MLHRTLRFPGFNGQSGRIWIDSCGHTSRSSVFAGGDLTPARASVVDAMASGKLAALAIHRSLTSSDSERFTEGLLLGGGVSFSVHSYFNPSEKWKPGEVAIMEDMDVFPEQTQATARNQSQEPDRTALRFLRGKPRSRYRINSSRSAAVLCLRDLRPLRFVWNILS